MLLPRISRDWLRLLLSVLRGGCDCLLVHLRRQDCWLPGPSGWLLLLVLLLLLLLVLLLVLLALPPCPLCRCLLELLLELLPSTCWRLAWC